MVRKHEGIAGKLIAELTKLCLESCQFGEMAMVDASRSTTGAGAVGAAGCAACFKPKAIWSTWVCFFPAVAGSHSDTFIGPLKANPAFPASDQAVVAGASSAPRRRMIAAPAAGSAAPSTNAPVVDILRTRTGVLAPPKYKVPTRNMCTRSEQRSMLGVECAFNDCLARNEDWHFYLAPALSRIIIVPLMLRSKADETAAPHRLVCEEVQPF